MGGEVTAEDRNKAWTLLAEIDRHMDTAGITTTAHYDGVDAIAQALADARAEGRTEAAKLISDAIRQRMIRDFGTDPSDRIAEEKTREQHGWGATK